MSNAWEIATRDGLAERDLELAENAARQADAVAKGDFQRAEILDTLARVLFLRGQKQNAIELQRKALDYAKGRQKTQFQETLDSELKG